MHCRNNPAPLAINDACDSSGHTRIKSHFCFVDNQINFFLRMGYLLLNRLSYSFFLSPFV